VGLDRAYGCLCLAFEQHFGASLDMQAITTATSIRALAALLPKVDA